LRGLAVSPTGAFLEVVNRELNLLQVIDLRDGSRTFRNIVASIPQPVNPVDVELSPTGLYAYTISESERELAINTIGIGATLNTVSRIAGPVGARLVLTGEDFTAHPTTTVSFNGVTVAPDLLSASSLTVTVPADAVSGPVTVVGSDATGPKSASNAVLFEVLAATPPGGIRIAGDAQPTGAPGLNAALSVSPTGDLAAIGGAAGVVYLLDMDTASPTFNQFFDQVPVPLAQVDDIAITPDGERAFVVEALANQIPVINVDRDNSVDFKTIVATIDLSAIAGAQISRVAVSPDAGTLLVSDPANSSVHIVAIAEGSPQQYDVVNSIALAGVGGANGEVREMAFHPAGRYAYLPVHDPDLAMVHVLDVDAATLVGQVPIPGQLIPNEIPISASFTPDGTRCVLLTAEISTVESRTLVMLDTSDPVNPSVSTSTVIPITASPAPEHVHVSPAGDLAIVNVLASGYYSAQIQTSPDTLVLSPVAGDVTHHSTAVDFGFAPDASIFFSVSPNLHSAFMQDFTEADNLELVTGDGQRGVAHQTLSTPARVKVTGSGSPIAGVAVTFKVIAGGGSFTGTGSATQVVVTDRHGLAEAEWQLGPDIGTGAHQAEASASNLAGSPIVFVADGIIDPNTIALEVSDVIPPDGTQDVSITTATLVTFSRAISTSTVGPATLFLHKGDLVPVPVLYGFTDENRKVSMTPVTSLNVDTLGPGPGSLWVYRREPQGVDDTGDLAQRGHPVHDRDHGGHPR
jgi:hypothetical protein